MTAPFVFGSRSFTCGRKIRQALLSFGMAFLACGSLLEESKLWAQTHQKPITPAAGAEEFQGEAQIQSVIEKLEHMIQGSEHASKIYRYQLQELQVEIPPRMRSQLAELSNSLLQTPQARAPKFESIDELNRSFQILKRGEDTASQILLQLKKKRGPLPKVSRSEDSARDTLVHYLEETVKLRANQEAFTDLLRDYQNRAAQLYSKLRHSPNTPPAERSPAQVSISEVSEILKWVSGSTGVPTPASLSESPGITERETPGNDNLSSQQGSYSSISEPGSSSAAPARLMKN